MRLLMTFEVTWRTLGQVLLLLAQFVAGVTVAWLVVGPVAAITAGVLTALVVRAFLRLGRR